MTARTALASGEPDQPQVAILVDRAGAPVLSDKGLPVRLTIHVRSGGTPHPIVPYGDRRFRRDFQVRPGQWIYRSLPLRLSHGSCVISALPTVGPPTRGTQTWGGVN